MAIPILIYGKSGSGKSRSLKNFKSDEITFINCNYKDLPIQNQFKYRLDSDNSAEVSAAVEGAPTDIIVIDDAGYLQTSTFFAGHSRPKSGGSTFDLYNQIGDECWSLIMTCKRKLPRQKRVYIIMHEISNDYGDVKVRTIGKIMDEKACIEGMFTICLRCMTDGKRHYFKTQASSNDVAKSPEGMFESNEIENDLKLVDERVKAFYGL